MFNGNKFEALPKSRISQTVGFVPDLLEENHEWTTSFINRADEWASTLGYEYHSMTDTCVVFKRVGG